MDALGRARACRCGWFYFGIFRTGTQWQSSRISQPTTQIVSYAERRRPARPPGFRQHLLGRAPHPGEQEIDDFVGDDFKAAHPERYGGA